MAAIEMTIKALSMADLEATVHALSERFQTDPLGPRSVETGPEAGAAVAASETAAGTRRPGRPKRVAAAAHPTPAAGEPAAAEDANAGAVQGVGDAAGGADGEVQSEDPVSAPDEAAEDQAEAKEADAGGAASEVAAAPKEGGREEAGGADRSGQPAEAGSLQGTSAVDEGAVHAVPEEAAAEAEEAEAEEATPEALEALARKVAAEKSFDTMKAVFDAAGIAKPKMTPPERIPEVMASLRAALGKL